MGRCVHNQGANQRHFEFCGTLPRPWCNPSLSVLDFPDPEAQGHLEKHPNIHVINTARDYWQARGRRPQTVERRQIENIKSAIGFARGDHISWLGHFDNDEFLHVPSHANVGMRLARLDQYDLYRLYDFNFDAKRAQYFPKFSI